MLKRIRLFSVAVADLEAATKQYQQLFGLEVVSPARETQFGFKAVSLGSDGEPLVELIQPVDPNSPLARFMKERAYPSNPKGEGVYMINIAVDDVKQAAQRVADHGGRLTRQGNMSNAVWVHPTSAHFAFIELLQAEQRPSGASRPS